MPKHTCKTIDVIEQLQVVSLDPVLSVHTYMLYYRENRLFFKCFICLKLLKGNITTHEVSKSPAKRGIAKSILAKAFGFVVPTNVPIKFCED